MSSRRRITGLFACVGLALGTVALGGSAASAASSNPGILTFGSVTIGQTATLSVVATPDPGYSWGSASGDGINSPWSLIFTDCSTLDAPCHFTESFTPTVPGLQSGTLSLFECPDVGGTCPSLDIDLSGNGVVGTGTMTAGPGTVAPGGAITATSVTPCPAPANEIVLKVLSSNGTVVSFDQGALTDSTNDWGGTINAPTSPGSYLVTASCSNGGVTVGNYNDIGITVPASAPTPTSTTLSTSASPSDFGQPVTLTATVLPTGGGTVSGSVTFADGSTTLSTVPVTGNQAVLTTSSLAVGSHPITATYNGTDASSSASLTQTVRKAPTTLTAPAVRRANPTPFNATLTSDGGPVSGVTVTFTVQKNGHTVSECSAPTNASGVASCLGGNALSLSGKRSYTASFAGNGDYQPSSVSARLYS